MRARSSQRGAFTLVEVMIVVAIIGLLAAVCTPNVLRARQVGQQRACINNLRQIDGAKQQWALEMRQSGSQTPQQSELDPYLGRSGNASNIVCPLGGPAATFVSSYTVNPVTNPPQCSIVGIGSDTPHVLP